MIQPNQLAVFTESGYGIGIYSKLDFFGYVLIINHIDEGFSRSYTLTEEEGKELLEVLKRVIEK